VHTDLFSSLCADVTRGWADPIELAQARLTQASQKLVDSPGGLATRQGRLSFL